MSKSINRTLSRIIGHYRYTQSDLLGSGFESKVYKAVHIIKKYQVALKVIQLDKLEHGISKTLLQSQIKCLQALRGTPHVINLLDVVKTEKQFYVFTELCKGDLGMKNGCKLQEKEAWKFIKQIIKGYRSLYEKQIIHRDIKPENMFVKSQGQIKIGDFGFAITKREAKKQSNYNIGSPSYMAPQVLHRNQYSQSSDIWAIGVSYFELITGKLPWDCQNQKQLVSQITRYNIGKTIDSADITEDSKIFLRKVLCFDSYSRITPQELFQYEVFGDYKLAKNPSFDKLSYSTVQTTKKTNKNNRTLQRNSSFQCENLVNNILQSKSTKNVFQKHSRRNSYDGNQSMPHNIDRISLPNKQKSFNCQKTVSIQQQKKILFKKIHKTSFDSAHNKDLQCEINKFSEQSIDKIISAHLQLSINAFRFLQTIDNQEFNQFCGTQLNVFKISLRNYIAKTMQKIQKLQKSDLLEGLVGKQEIKRYIQSQYYERAYTLLRNYDSMYQKNLQFARYRSKARQQKPKAIANAGFSLLNLVKQIVKDSCSKDVLQKMQQICILTQVFSYIAKNKYLSNEVILGSVKVRKNLLNTQKILKRIEDLQKLK